MHPIILEPYFYFIFLLKPPDMSQTRRVSSFSVTLERKKMPSKEHRYLLDHQQFAPFVYDADIFTSCKNIQNA